MESHAEDMTVLACKLCKLSSGKWYVRCVWAQAGLPELQELNRDALRGAVADRGALRRAAARSGKIGGQVA